MPLTSACTTIESIPMDTEAKHWLNQWYVVLIAYYFSSTGLMVLSRIDKSYVFYIII